MPDEQEPSEELGLRSDIEPLDPDDPDDRSGPIRDDDPEDDDDREHRVARRPNPLPAREEDEEELAEADILEELDLEDTRRINRADA
jgi:hypothetical protein